MAFGTETRTGYLVYDVTLEHTATGVRVDLHLDLYKLVGTATEQQKDALFQGFLNHMATLSGVTVVTATKTGQHQQPVTVG